MNSNLCFGRAFKIFLKRPSQQKVSSQIIVFPSGSFSFNIFGLKFLWQLSLLWLCRWMLSMILIRLSCHKFAKDLIGNGSRHNFILLRLHTLSYDKKYFVLRRTCSGMSFIRMQKNPIKKMATWLGDSDLYKWVQEWINPPPEIIGKMPLEWPRSWVKVPVSLLHGFSSE